jgi:AcrR family transcriptional regulator
MKHNQTVVDPAPRRPGRPSVDRREEILTAAERLYDSIGYEKTTIGDIARELGMSPANLYRSFPNRHAIDDALARRKLMIIEDAAWAAARRGSDPATALREIATTVLHETQRLVFSDRRMHHLCAIAARERWPSVLAYLGGLHGAVRHVVMEGQRSGVLRKCDPDAAAETVCAALTKVWHPQMIETYADEDLVGTAERICELMVTGLST